MSVTAPVICVTAWSGMTHIAMEHVNDVKSINSRESTNNMRRSVDSQRAVTLQHHHTVTRCITRADEVGVTGLTD